MSRETETQPPRVRAPTNNRVIVDAHKPIGSPSRSKASFTLGDIDHRQPIILCCGSRKKDNARRRKVRPPLTAVPASHPAAMTPCARAQKTPQILVLPSPLPRATPHNFPNDAILQQLRAQESHTVSSEPIYLLRLRRLAAPRRRILGL